MATDLLTMKAELVKAETALESFRDGGYHVGDAVAEIVDNGIQAGATRIRIDYTEMEVPDRKATRYEVEAFGIADNGSGIPARILANVLTVGFSTRYGDRTGIGRFGVGFKLASISQASRLEVYTRPEYLEAVQEDDGNGGRRWVAAQPNQDGRIFRTHLDLREIKRGAQKHYDAEEVDEFPPEFAHLMDGFEKGTLVVWRDLDRLNHGESYIERADEKLRDLDYFLSRAYRHYIDGGLEIFLRDMKEPLTPYDPLFRIDNRFADKLAGEPMKGDHVDDGTIRIGGHDVQWRVYLTPANTRLEQGGGGEDGPRGKGQFKKLHIPDNEGKISFLRHNREISYTTVPKMLPDGVDKVDRYIGIEVSFPPALDEYFAVKHIKRGAEPVHKLREELRKALQKPVKLARRRIRDVWANTKKAKNQAGADASGDRQGPETVVKDADPGMPAGKAGLDVTKQQEIDALRRAAEDAGITDPSKRDEFVSHALQKPVVAIDVEWAGRGLLDIEHLTKTVVVRINRRHPFIQHVYQPLKEAIVKRASGMDEDAVVHLLERAADGIDLLLFAYAKAENMSSSPEEDYMELREDWGKFAAMYLKRRSEVLTS